MMYSAFPDVVALLSGLLSQSLCKMRMEKGSGGGHIMALLEDRRPTF